MGTAEQDWQLEQQRVDRVMRIIEQQLNTIQTDVLDTKDEIVDFRKTFWDDVTLNFDSMDEIIESHASMKQQAEVMQERERTYRHAEKQAKILRKLQQSPYFGRIDFTEEGTTDTEQVYLGIASLRHQDEYVIYDWRAPVSSLYYDHAPGPATYQTPNGQIDGTMELKRQYMIRGGQIRTMFDTGVTIGDEMLQEVLGQHADNQMKSIVATIQQEQNRIIRNEQSRLLIVQGAAGSGKTSAALQRVAYLLYRYRDTLSSEQIILFSPNPMFNSYVATVLPELGEDNMQQTTFQQYLEKKLSRSFRVEDPFAQMEYTLMDRSDADYTARLAGIRFKTSAAYMRIIEQYAEQLKQQGMLFKSIRLRGRELVSAEKIAELFYALSPSMSIPYRLKEVAEQLLRELTKAAKAEKKKRWVEEAIELLDKDAYTEVFEKLSEKQHYTESSFNDDDQERDMLATLVVQEKFKKLRRGVKLFRFLDVQAMYRQLLTQSATALGDQGKHTDIAAWQSFNALTLAAMDEGILPYEDATPYLYFLELMEGFQANTTIRHLFIDEAQDYSPFQFAFLKRLYPSAKITALGDLNQSIYAHAATVDGFEPLEKLFASESTERIVLTRSYRSTRPIVEFTQGMVAGGEQIEPFNRAGEKPVITHVVDTQALHRQIKKRIAAWHAEELHSIAIICKTAAECEEAYQSLHKEHGLQVRLIHKETSEFEGGTVIIPSYLAKGMEFDAVILYNASAACYHREEERKLFYTACTRAMHKLHLYTIGDVSPFVKDAKPDTYCIE